MIDPTSLSPAARDQRALALWAATCAERVLPLFEQVCPNDDRPRRAIAAARAWARGELSIGEARARALRAHAAARATSDQVACAAARAAGHAAATAHAAGHARHAAAYAAASVAAGVEGGTSFAIRLEEGEWQAAQLPPHLRAIALPGRSDFRAVSADRLPESHPQTADAEETRGAAE